MIKNLWRVKLILLVFLSQSFFHNSYAQDDVAKDDTSKDSTNKDSTGENKIFPGIFKKDKTPPPGLPVVITVEGLDDAEKANALAYLEISKYKERPELNEKMLKIYHKRAEKNIKASLQPFGFYQAEVDGSLTQDSSGVWQAHYQVKAGERVKITKIDIKITGGGAEEAKVIALKEKVALQENHFLDHELYETEKSKLITEIGKLGYSKVKFEKKQLLIDPEKNTAEITLYIDTGKQFFLGEFRLHQDFLQPKLINKYIVGVQPGDPYSQKNLLELQQLLSASGYFSIVNVKPEFADVEQQKVPIDITLTAAKKHRLSFGGGYDTDVGINVSAGWKNRLLNSYGHHSDVLLKLSSVKTRLKGTYWIPIGNPKYERLSIMANLESETLDDVEWDVFDLETAYNFKWRDWSNKLYLEYKIENSTVDGLDSETNQLLSIGGEMQGAFFEEGAYPRKGWAAYADLRGTPAFSLSDTAYIRAHLKSKIIFPVLEGGRLILRGELGFAEVDEIIHYPGSLRFFAGGDQSVRGYDWKSLGSTTEDGSVIGGRNVITTSLEYNHKILSDWAAAGFVDAGNAYDDKLDKLYYGAGFGARWISPVGLIRFDLGFPLNEDDLISSSSTHFYFGFEVNL